MSNQQPEKKNVLNDLIEIGKAKGQLTNKEIFDAPSSEENRLSIENLETVRFIL